MDGEELTPEEQQALAEICKKISLLIQQHRTRKSNADSRPTVPRKFDKDKKFMSERMGRQLSTLGLDPTVAINRDRSQSRGRKRERSLGRGDSDAMDLDVDQPNKKLRMRSTSVSRSRPPSEVIPGEGFKDSAQKVKALKRLRNLSRGGARMLDMERQIESFLLSSQSISSLESAQLEKTVDADKIKRKLINITEAWIILVTEACILYSIPFILRISWRFWNYEIGRACVLFSLMQF